MDSPKDNFVSRLARSATEADWKVVREIVDEEKRRRCLLAYDQSKYLGINFNRARAARMLGTNERTIRRWIKEFEKLLALSISLGLLLFELYDFWQ